MTPERGATRATLPATVEHFEHLEQQQRAAHLGMWIFLASEALLFAGLFALYAAYRLEHPAAFARGVDENPKLLGSLNTLILLGSSFTVAMGVHQSRQGRPRRAAMLLALTIALGLGFLVIKGLEYRAHVADGVLPGGLGAYAARHVDPGMVPFHTLYYAMTGLHALHVIAGLGVLGVTTLRLARGRLRAPHDHPVALAGTYWHLVDVVWIFLWPLFYLTGAR